jgi:hypothetical protein
MGFRPADGGEIADREPDLRVVRVEIGDDDLADLALRHGVAGAGPHDLDDQVLVQHHSFARALVS